MSSNEGQPSGSSVFRELKFSKKARLTTLLSLKPGFLRSKSASSAAKPIPEEEAHDVPWDPEDDDLELKDSLSKTRSEESLSTGMVSCQSLPVGIEGALAATGGGAAGSAPGGSSKSMTMPRGGGQAGGGPEGRRRLGMRRGSSMTDIDRLAAQPKLLAAGFPTSPVSESGSSSPAVLDKRRSANALSG